MTIRVLLGEMSAMARSALRGSLLDCADIELIRSTPSAGGFGEADVVVLCGAGVGGSDTVMALVEAAPIGVVAIDEDGTTGNLYRFDREAWQFVEGGRHALADAIRVAAGAR